jgi:signal transduction histidine kinase/ActR/RegA family two-component response regulator
MSQLFKQDQGGIPQQTGDDDLPRLRAARDAALQAAREAIRDTTRLTRLISILNDSGPLHLLLDRVLSTLSELFLADIVVLLDPIGTGSYSPLAAIGLPEDILQRPFSDEESSYTRLLMQTGIPVLIENADTDQKIDFQLRDMGAETVIGLPMDSSSTARGALILARCRPEPFLSSDVNLLMAMSYRIGRTLIEAQRSVQFEKIAQSGREINRHLDLAAVSAEAARIFPVIVCADASALILDNSNGESYCAAQTGLHSSCSTALCTLAEHLMTSSLLREGEPFSTADMGEISAQLSLQSLNILPVRALLAIPIHRQDLINGILFAVRFSAIAFNSSTSQIAMIYAEQISAALENSSLYQAVHNELVERKRLEEERRQWERQQQQLQKAESLNRMAGAIAHNFNNMLSAVTGNLELALMDSPPDSLVKILNQAMKASHRAAEVSGLMLTYLGQSFAELEVLDLSALCRSNLSLLRNALQKDVELEPDLPSSGPAVKANASQMQQMLKNLVTNASESMGDHQGAVHLTVKTVCLAEIPATYRSPIDWQSRNDTFACMEVKDSGSGISDKEIEQIFDPFFSTKFTGRGLGLPVVLGIVRAHQGVITVESTQGKGSIFKVFFPLSTEHLPLQPRKSTEILQMESGKTVLLVDDEEIVRKMAAAMLKRIGFKVIEAKDGVEAVDVFRQHQSSINIVLCDLTMPRMDGWETLAALHELEPAVPIVLASGYDEAQVMQGNHTKRPRAFLHKPYQLSELKAALTLALSQ